MNAKCLIFGNCREKFTAQEVDTLKKYVARWPCRVVAPRSYAPLRPCRLVAHRCLPFHLRNNRYVDDGGSCLFLFKETDGAKERETNANNFLEPFGMSINNDSVVRTVYYR